MDKQPIASNTVYPYDVELIQDTFNEKSAYKEEGFEVLTMIESFMNFSFDQLE